MDLLINVTAQDKPSMKSGPPAALPSSDLVTLASIVRTEQLQRRPARAPDYKNENRALVALAQALADAPRTILQALADTILELFKADSAGLSLLTADGKRFYWPAIAGDWNPHIGGGTPRDFSPCGDVLEHNAPMLFTHWERRYPYLSAAPPSAEEALLIPFYVEGRAVGTIWAITHRKGREFDAEDLRQLESLSRFASAAYQAVTSLNVVQERAEAVRLSEALMVSSVDQHELIESSKLLNAQLRTEIAARATAQNALSESEMRFRALVTSSSDVIYRMSPDWGEMLELQGRSFLPDTENSNQSWFKQYIPVAQQAGVREAINEAIRTKSMFQLEHQVLQVDGTHGWTFSRAIPLLGDNGEIVEWFGMAADVTERKHSEQNIRVYAERARFVMDSMPHKIFTAKANGVPDYFNEQWMKFAGNSLDRISHWEWMEFVHRDDAQATGCAWQHSIDEGEPFQFEHRLRTEDGSYRWHLTRAVPFRDATGDLSMWIGSSTDIQDEKSAATSLLKTEKLAAVGRLAASIAHEINNPLDAVMNNVYLAQHEPGLPEQALAYLQTADAELRRVAHITRQTLGFYRESTSQATFAMLSLLSSVTDLLEGKIRSKMTTFSVECDPALRVTGVFGELRQVVSNLILNSIDALAPNGTVRLRVSTKHYAGTDWVWLTIADDGSGISAIAKSQIFEPFFTTKESVGTGLGLYVSKQIIERHGGLIRVRSSVAGRYRGTVFCILLPGQFIANRTLIS